MNILVTGATGFLGQHVVAACLAQRHSVTAVARTLSKAQSMPWFSYVRFVAADVGELAGCVRQTLGDADAIVHLAWTGLPNYRELFHFEQNLPRAYQFLKSAVMEGYSRVLVAGTCLEYGPQQGCLHEETETCPDIPYGLAKDTLRKFLQHFQQQHQFDLLWARLFYLFGEGQNPKSLIPALEAAIQRNDKVFPMSGGEQTRDFISAPEAARRIVMLVNTPKAAGVFNICSGRPITVRRFVEDKIAAAGSNIELQLGAYPYPDYEPFAFWGDSTKYSSLESAFAD